MIYPSQEVKTNTLTKCLRTPLTLEHISTMLVLIDNYDSFTWNLVQYCGELGAETKVFRNDKISADEVMTLNPAGIVLSPGPGTPDDSGICLAMIEKAANTNTPLLGICLGHQSIGQVFGGKVIRGPAPMHGKVSAIRHENKSVFAGAPNPMQATRYHSLIVEKDSLPDCLEITAESDDGIIMGLMHKDHPIHGLQFHPESIETKHGHDLLRNFITLNKEG